MNLDQAIVPERLTRLAGQAAQYFTLRYSRGQEYQADDLGIRYLTMGQHAHRALVPFDVPTAFWWEAPAGALVRPPRQLVGWGRAHVPAGETRRVVVDVDPRALEVWDPEVRSWRTMPGEHVLHVGRSSRDLRTSVAVAR